LKHNPNPAEDTEVPAGAKSSETYAYSLAEVNRMLNLMLSPMASAILAVAHRKALVAAYLAEAGHA